MDQKSEQNINDKTIDGLLYFYEVKMQGLGSYSNIVWSRFNWFLTLELALLGFLFTKSESLPEYETLKHVIVCAGLFVSLLWLTLGILDSLSLKRQTDKIKTLNSIISKTLNLDNLFRPNDDQNRIFRQTNLLYVLPFVLIICWPVVYCLLP